MRTNIPAEAQGRAWGMIGVLSQLGCVVAYAVSGVTADALGRVRGRGVGRGAAAVVIIAGICLALVSITISFPKSIRELEIKKD